MIYNLVSQVTRISEIPKPLITAVLLTGSYQYGTYVETQSDLDVVIIHTLNYDQLYSLETNGNAHNRQFESTVLLNDIETKADIRLITLDTFAKRLYKGDMNAVEYIYSPFMVAPRFAANVGRRAVSLYAYKEVFEKSFNQTIKHKLLKSSLGFLNGLKEKRKMPELVNPNNLVRMANIYYLVEHNFYPYNMHQACDSIGIDLWDPAKVNYNSLELMIDSFEKAKKKLGEGDEVYEGLAEYSNVTKFIYEQSASMYDDHRDFNQLPKTTMDN